jgi:hypothetical protein
MSVSMDKGMVTHCWKMSFVAFEPEPTWFFSSRRKMLTNLPQFQPIMFSFESCNCLRSLPIAKFVTSSPTGQQEFDNQ